MSMTPDEDVIIDRVPGAPGLVVASACSGHGFQFMVLMGRLAADLVERRGEAATFPLRGR